MVGKILKSWDGMASELIQVAFGGDGCRLGFGESWEVVLPKESHWMCLCVNSKWLKCEGSTTMAHDTLNVGAIVCCLLSVE